jgi:release factor glutamine methyltransferase
MPTVRTIQQQALAQLTSDSAALDVQLLLAKALGKTRTWLYAWPEYQLTLTEQQQFDALLRQRLAGQPIAYLLGQREFWSQELLVTPAVLIPRPETELLVETALQVVAATNAVVADLGTGSGAIALALAAARPAWQLHATELSQAAWQVASANLQRLQLPNVQLHQGSWFAPLPALPFDLIVSNPPYIDADDPHLSQGDVRFEPRLALVAAEQGLADLRYISDYARQYLCVGGWLALEHGWQQGAAVRELLLRYGYQQVGTERDGAGHERVSYACWNGAKP